MIEQGSMGDDLIRLVINQESKVAEVAVNIADQRIQDHHITQSRQIRRTELLIIFCYGLKATVGNQPADRQKSIVFTREQLTCILSSKNPWFCQSKFLGIATEIPW